MDSQDQKITEGTVFKYKKWTDLSVSDQEGLYPGDCAYTKNTNRLYYISGYNQKYYESNNPIDNCEFYSGFLYINEYRKIGVLFNVRFTYGCEDSSQNQFIFKRLMQLKCVDILKEILETDDVSIIPGDSHYMMEYKQTGTNIFATEEIFLLDSKNARESSLLVKDVEKILHNFVIDANYEISVLITKRSDLLLLDLHDKFQRNILNTWDVYKGEIENLEYYPKLIIKNNKSNKNNNDDNYIMVINFLILDRNQIKYKTILSKKFIEITLSNLLKHKIIDRNCGKWGFDV